MRDSQNIVVTGASKGIGFELTKRFLQLGHKVYAISRSVESLVKLSKEYSSLVIVQLDITKDLIPLVELLKGEPVHHLINNAGYLVNKSLDKLTDEDIRFQYEVNVIAPIRLVRDLLPLFMDGATICNISSMGGVQGSVKFPGLAAYSSSKGALSVLTECLAEELQDRSIKCNALALGAVQTEMLASAFPNYQAPFTSEQMADYVSKFVLESSMFYNGKVLSVSSSTP